MKPLNALTVDVEDYFHVSALAGSIKKSAWESIPLRVENNTRQLLDLFDEFEIKSTFFVLGWVADRAPQLVKEIAARGHEVACHGYSHELVYNQSIDEFREETLRSKHLLEDLTQAPVNGYRAASYSIIERSLWALDVLIEAGFIYDSSIFPIRHDRYGLPDASEDPGRITSPGGASIIEFPLSTAKVLGYRLPVAGGGYFRLYPYALTKMGLSQVNRQSRPFIFYLHPWEIDYEQPKVRAKWFSRFRHYNNLEKCMPRLRRLLGDFRFGTASEVLRELDLLPG